MEKFTTLSDYSLNRGKRSYFFRRYGMVLVFLGPFLLFFLLFCVYPFVYRGAHLLVLTGPSHQACHSRGCGRNDRNETVAKFCGSYPYLLFFYIPRICRQNECRKEICRILQQVRPIHQDFCIGRNWYWLSLICIRKRASLAI